ncbi:MAG: protease inhibitor I42 family protein [Candidatus Omnitrophica bacterium]|nr:protease inhibitor I42 family protein [Candidatus Omnitrophota bacterium]
MNKKIFLLTFFLFFCFAANLFAEDPSPVMLSSQGETATAIETNIGNDIMIALESNRTTGYEWQLAEPLNDGILAFIKSKYIPSQTNLIGAEGKEIWTFQALKEGKTNFSFIYVRPWEKGIAPAARKIFVIVIRK